MERAKILIYADPHLSVKDYGMHNDYSKESLECFHKITEKAEEVGATHLIGLGDFTYGRFTKLEYRLKVEEELERQSRIVNGNHYVLKGNHDEAGYGMTEYEYYLHKKAFKPATNFSIGNVNFTMVNHGQHKKVIPNIKLGQGQINILLAHDYFSSEGVWLPGNTIKIESMTEWYGIDHMIVGHIHKSGLYKARIIKEEDGVPRSHNLTLHYPGSLARPSYQEGEMDLVGNLVLLTIEENGEFNYEIVEVELPPLEESFNIALKENEKIKEEEKEKQKIDISDIVKRMEAHRNETGNPEDIVRNLEGIDQKYKDKAIELLKIAELE